MIYEPNKSTTSFDYFTFVQTCMYVKYVRCQRFTVPRSQLQYEYNQISDDF